MRSRSQEIRRALDSREFAYLGRDAKSGWLRFDGPLAADSTEIRVEVRVDPLGIAVPKVRLKAFPESLKGVLTPHLGRDELCYLANDSVVLNIFDPAGQVLTCLDRAQDVLGQLARGELTRDAADEFFAYWGDATPLYLADLSPKATGYCEVLSLARVGAKGVFALTDDSERTTRKLKAIGFILKSGGLRAVRVGTQVSPQPLAGRWPPHDVESLLGWQNQLDPQCVRAIRKGLTKAQKRKYRTLLCLITSPRLMYGFKVEFEAPPKFQQGMRRRAVDRRALLAKSKVIPFTLVRIDDEYIARRSAPGLATLGGRRIAVVGCGTVGGYLADLLVKAGAGTAGGELRLVDKDSLAPGNVGRHRLGFNSVLKNKARALADELTRGAPSADISFTEDDVTTMKLSRLDLLIDATGDEALGHWLAAAVRSAFVPTLSVWVEGTGVAVRALLRDNQNAACLRCLNGSDRALLYPVTNEDMPTELAGHGCESLYVPFPATVSVHAACLAAEMVTAWANGSPRPLLRTRIVAPGFSAGTMDVDPTKLTGCPACGT
jgi:molybdopterin/thiamine biosynthesis adenylyltransferase